MNLNLTKQRGKSRTFILDSFGLKNGLYPLDLSDNSPCVLFWHKMGGFGYQPGIDLVHGRQLLCKVIMIILHNYTFLGVKLNKLPVFGTKIYRFLHAKSGGSIGFPYTNRQNYPFLWPRLSYKLFQGSNTGAVGHG
jgi:hypothetical protein